jgi:hypothetical protein
MWSGVVGLMAKKMIGTDVIVIYSMTLINDIYRLRIQAIQTESGQILAAYGYDIKYNDFRINRVARNNSTYNI